MNDDVSQMTFGNKVVRAQQSLAKPTDSKKVQRKMPTSQILDLKSTYKQRYSQFDVRAIRCYCFLNWPLKPAYRCAQTFAAVARCVTYTTIKESLTWSIHEVAWMAKFIFPVIFDIPKDSRNVALILGSGFGRPSMPLFDGRFRVLRMVERKNLSDTQTRLGHQWVIEDVQLPDEDPVSIFL